jgi:hypothetical protein
MSNKKLKGGFVAWGQISNPILNFKNEIQFDTEENIEDDNKPIRFNVLNCANLL